VLLAAVAALAATGGFVHSAKAFDPEGIESPADEGFLEIPDAGAPAPGDNGNFSTASHDNGRGGNTFTNDPCLDPPPTAPPPENRRRTVQSETEVAVNGKNVVVGYNDSFGFYDNQQGLSGFAYSTNGNGDQQTDITDPMNNVQRVIFNADGYAKTEVDAVGTAIEQTTSRCRSIAIWVTRSSRSTSRRASSTSPRSTSSRTAPIRFR